MVDRSGSGTQKGAQRRPLTTHADRQVVGLSLPPDIAQAFKSEAARRRMSIRDLFIEIWTEYSQKKRS